MSTESFIETEIIENSDRIVASNLVLAAATLRAADQNKAQTFKERVDEVLQAFKYAEGIVRQERGA